MPWKAISPLKVYALLPKILNCKKCGANNCMAFAVELVNMETRLEKCLPLLEEKYRKNYLELGKILSPPVKEVEFGNESRKIKLGMLSSDSRLACPRRLKGSSGTITSGRP